MVAVLDRAPTFRAQARMARIAPRKMRLIVNLVRGQDYGRALAILRAMPQRGASYAIKLIKSAFANASQKIREDRLGIDPDDLCLVEATVDTGPTIWGNRPSSMRRPQWIHRRTSHVTFVLQARPRPEEKAEKKEKKGKQEKNEEKAPEKKGKK